MKYLYIILLAGFMAGCSDKPRPCYPKTEIGYFISQEKVGSDYAVKSSTGTYYIWTALNGMEKGDRLWLQDRRLRNDGLCYGVSNQIHLCTNKLNQCYWTN